MGRNDEHFIINAKPDNNFFEFFSWYKILNNFKPDYPTAPKLEWVKHAKIFACFTHSFSSPGKYNIAIKRKGGLQMSTLLEAKEVTKIYARAQRPSLNKVSFSVSKSEFIAIMGASGSGKTTLLNVLSTIDTPTGGSITIDGINIKNLTDSEAADFRRD